MAALVHSSKRKTKGCCALDICGALSLSCAYTHARAHHNSSHMKKKEEGEQTKHLRAMTGVKSRYYDVADTPPAHPKQPRMRKMGRSGGEAGGLLQSMQFAGKQQKTGPYGGTSPYVAGRLTRGNGAGPRSKQASLGCTHESQSVNKWGDGSPEVRGRDDGCRVCVCLCVHHGALWQQRELLTAVMEQRRVGCLSVRTTP